MGEFALNIRGTSADKPVVIQEDVKCEKITLIGDTEQFVKFDFEESGISLSPGYLISQVKKYTVYTKDVTCEFMPQRDFTITSIAGEDVAYPKIRISASSRFTLSFKGVDFPKEQSAVVEVLLNDDVYLTTSIHNISVIAKYVTVNNYNSLRYWPTNGIKITELNIADSSSYNVKKVIIGPETISINDEKNVFNVDVAEKIIITSKAATLSCTNITQIPVINLVANEFTIDASWAGIEAEVAQNLKVQHNKPLVVKLTGLYIVPTFDFTPSTDITYDTFCICPDSNCDTKCSKYPNRLSLSELNETTTTLMNFVIVGTNEQNKLEMSEIINAKKSKVYLYAESSEDKQHVDFGTLSSIHIGYSAFQLGNLKTNYEPSSDVIPYITTDGDFLIERINIYPPRVYIPYIVFEMKRDCSLKLSGVDYPQANINEKFIFAESEYVLNVQALTSFKYVPLKANKVIVQDEKSYNSIFNKEGCINELRFIQDFQNILLDENQFQLNGQPNIYTNLKRSKKLILSTASSIDIGLTNTKIPKLEIDLITPNSKLTFLESWSNLNNDASLLTISFKESLTILLDNLHQYPQVTYSSPDGLKFTSYCTCPEGDCISECQGFSRNTIATISQIPNIAKQNDITFIILGSSLEKPLEVQFSIFQSNYNYAFSGDGYVKITETSSVSLIDASTIKINTVSFKEVGMTSIILGVNESQNYNINGKGQVMIPLVIFDVSEQSKLYFDVTTDSSSQNSVKIMTSLDEVEIDLRIQKQVKYAITDPSKFSIVADQTTLGYLTNENKVKKIITKGSYNSITYGRDGFYLSIKTSLFSYGKADFFNVISDSSRIKIATKTTATTNPPLQIDLISNKLTYIMLDISFKSSINSPKINIKDSTTVEFSLYTTSLPIEFEPANKATLCKSFIIGDSSDAIQFDTMDQFGSYINQLNYPSDDHKYNLDLVRTKAQDPLNSDIFTKKIVLTCSSEQNQVLYVNGNLERITIGSQIDVQNVGIKFINGKIKITPTSAQTMNIVSLESIQINSLPKDVHIDGTTVNKYLFSGAKYPENCPQFITIGSDTVAITLATSLSIPLVQPKKLIADLDSFLLIPMYSEKYHSLTINKQGIESLAFSSDKVEINGLQELFADACDEPLIITDTTRLVLNSNNDTIMNLQIKDLSLKLITIERSWNKVINDNNLKFESKNITVILPEGIENDPKIVFSEDVDFIRYNKYCISETKSNECPFLERKTLSFSDADEILGYNTFNEIDVHIIGSSDEKKPILSEKNLKGRKIKFWSESAQFISIDFNGDLESKNWTFVNINVQVINRKHKDTKEIKFDSLELINSHIKSTDEIALTSGVLIANLSALSSTQFSSITVLTSLSLFDSLINKITLGTNTVQIMTDQIGTPIINLAGSIQVQTSQDKENPILMSVASNSASLPTVNLVLTNKENSKVIFDNSWENVDANNIKVSSSSNTTILESTTGKLPDIETNGDGEFSKVVVPEQKPNGFPPGGIAGIVIAVIVVIVVVVVVVIVMKKKKGNDNESSSNPSIGDL